MKFPVFRNDQQEAFYHRMLAECRCTDSCHRALFYKLGLSKDTRVHVQELFDFSNGGIKPEGLSASWQTRGSLRICRLAFNLWNGWSHRSEKNGIRPRMNCLIAKLLPTFLKPYVYAIRSTLANRYLSSESGLNGSKKYTYDQRGNIQHVEGRTLRGLTNANFTFNGLNQLTKVKLENGKEVSYTYNGDGLLYERVEGDQRTRY